MEEENLRQKTKVGIYWNGLNQVATQGMQFVVGIIMARQLTPEDYGITALPAVFMAIASMLIDGGFGIALIRKPEVTEKDLSTSFYYSLVMGMFMYTCLFVAAPWIANFYNTPILTSLIRITALNFLWGPLSTPQYVILNRRLDFKTQTRISVINKIISAIVGIYAAYNGFGLWALVISGLVSSLMGLIQIWWVVRWIPRERFSRDSFRYLWDFGNKMIGTRLINTVFANIAPIIIGKYYSPTTLGIYNRANNYAQLPALELNGVVQNVAFPSLSKMLDDDERLIRSYRTMINAVSFVIFPIMFLMSALSRPLVILMITEKWENCIPLLQVLCLYLMWGPMSIMNCNLLQVKGRSDLLLKAEVWKKMASLIIMAASLPFGIFVFCCTRFLDQMITIYINIKCVEKVVDFSYWQQMKDVLPILVLGIISFAGAFVCTLIFFNYWSQLIVGGIVGSVIYVGGAFLFKFPELQEVKYMLSRKQ